MIKAFQKFDLLGNKAFEKAVIDAPMSMVAEMPNEACFYYISQGSAKVSTPLQHVTAYAEEGLVLQCGNYINQFIETNGSKNCEAIAVHLAPALLQEVYGNNIPDLLSSLEKTRPIPFKKEKASALMKTYITSLQFYFDNPELVSDDLLKLKIKELILLLTKTNEVSKIKTLFSQLFTPQEYDFKEVIEANIFNQLSISELASLCQMSLSSFKRTFARHYETSPKKYISTKRLEQASKLLLVTDLRVSEIAYDCGFNDLAHFSKSFLKQFGHAPSKHRDLSDLVLKELD